MKRCAGLVLIATVLSIWIAVPAQAQVYPGGVPLRPGSECVVTVDGVVIGTGVASGEHVCPVPLTCPPGFTGPTQFVISGTAASGEAVQVPVTVNCPGAPGPAGPIAITGTNVTVGMLILGVLAVAGVGLLVAGRRKKVHAE